MNAIFALSYFARAREKWCKLRLPSQEASFESFQVNFPSSANVFPFRQSAFEHLCALGWMNNLYLRTATTLTSCRRLYPPVTICMHPSERSLSEQQFYPTLIVIFDIFSLCTSRLANGPTHTVSVTHSTQTSFALKRVRIRCTFFRLLIPVVVSYHYRIYPYIVTISRRR